MKLQMAASLSLPSDDYEIDGLNGALERGKIETGVRVWNNCQVAEWASLFSTDCLHSSGMLNNSVKYFVLFHLWSVIQATFVSACLFIMVY